jgi:dipeptidyl-peptidase 4
MKKLTLSIVALMAFAAAGFAQEKLLTLEEIYSPDRTKRVNFSGSPTRFAWATEGSSFKQVRENKLLRVNALTGEAVSYLDTARFAQALTSGLSINAEAADRMANNPGLQFNRGETAILLNHMNDLWVYDSAGGRLRRLTNNKDEEKEADFSPDGQWVSFVRNNDLFVVDLARGEEKQLTRDGTERIHNGYLVWVYEEELYGRGNNRGYWWSPDSKKIAFLRLDDTPVPRFVLSNEVPNDPVIEDTRYPKAGDPNPWVRLGIADITKSSLVPNVSRIPGSDRLPASVRRIGDAVQFVDISNYKPEDVLIGRVTWTPDSASVVFQAQNREQTFLDLNAASLDGKVRKQFTETSPAWVGINDNPHYLKHGSYVWHSDRAGWSHLYYYDRDGKLIRPLTEGKWEVRSFHGVDESTGWAYFSGTKDSHIATNVYRVSLRGGPVQRLTQGEGTHSANFNSTFTHFIHSWSDITTPTQYRLMRADGTLERVLDENKVDVLGQYKLSEPEFMKVRTRDGFEMEAYMIRPPDFDPSRKYPVMQYTYAGPQAPQVRNGWAGTRYMWHQMLAQKGYIIWVMDNRTASGKGIESAWPVYKNFGILEHRDIEEGVAFLKRLPYVDPDRIGIWGWSYGGFMTSFAMTHSKNFKMGIAGGSVTDWHLYDSIYTERYMATPQNNPAGYARTSVVKAAKDLHGKLLLIHGVMDNNVHMQNTMQLAYELQKHGKQFDLMLYPTQRHGVVDPAQAYHMYTMMTEFIERNL